jgi:hypothetical protein
MNFNLINAYDDTYECKCISLLLDKAKKEIDNLIETFIEACLICRCPRCSLPVKTLKRLVFDDLFCNGQQFLYREQAVMCCDRGHEWMNDLNIKAKTNND